MWDDVTSLDLDHLTCSLCLEYLLPPLYNCSAGHTNACGSCFIELGNNPGCPICRCPMTGMRNFALEGIVRSTPLTCKFKENGCRSCPTGAEYTAHVLNCKFRELVICPLKSSGRLRSCEWKGAIPSVAGHLKNDHDFKNVITAGKGALIIQNVLEAQTPQIGLAMALLEPEDHDVGFLIYIRKMDSEVTIVVQGLGTATEMDNFKFSLGLPSDNPGNSCLRWDTHPLAISEGFKWQSSRSVWPLSVDAIKSCQTNNTGCLYLYWEIQPIIEVNSS